MSKTTRARKVPVWISYDLGAGKDYTNMYRWLKGYEALECGNSTAMIYFSKERGRKLVPSLKKDLTDHVNLNEEDRIFIWYKGTKGVLVSQWLFGTYKVDTPWKNVEPFYN